MIEKNWKTQTARVFLLSGESQDLPPKALGMASINRKAGTLLRFYGQSPEIGPVEILVEDNRPVFFIEQGVKTPELPLFFDRHPVELKNFSGGPVDALYFSSQQDLNLAREAFRENNIPTYEADIRPAERFLMERFIDAQAEVTGLAKKENGLTLFLNPKMSPCAGAVSLTTLSLDIETGVRTDRLYSAALHFTGGGKDYRRQLMLADENSQEHKEIEFFKTEKDLLLRFIQLTQEYDPDVLIGWNVVSFDLLFLKKKSAEFKIPFLIGRGRRPAFIKERISGGHFAVIPGRVVLDGPVALRSAFYQFEDFSLETVSQQLLGEGKLISRKEDKIGEIERMFREDKLALAAYNLQDAVLVSKIFEKIGLVRLTVTRSQISGLLWDQIGLSTAAFDHFFLPRLHRQGFVAGNVADVRLDEHAAGGYVMPPKGGLHEHILVFDFKSLYPSIICTFNIDPLSRLLAGGKGDIVTPKGFRFSRRTTLLSGFIQELLKKRQSAIQANDAPLSQAIKILMNSFYGVMGSAGCRFYHPDLPTAITSTGQWILIESMRWLEPHGLEILYGDTDSLFARVSAPEGLDFTTRGKELALGLTAYWKERLRKEFEVDSFLEVKFEKYYRKFLLPMARGSEGGAKKRYAGLRVSETQEKIEFVGLEAVRSDWTKLAKEFQEELYRRIFYGEEIEKWLKNILIEIRSGKHDAKLVYRKRLRKPLAEYQKNVPPHVKAARMLSSPGRQIRYLISREGPVPADFKHSGLDYEHYIEKQIRPIADSILEFLGLSMDLLTKPRQFSLFD